MGSVISQPECPDSLAALLAERAAGRGAATFLERPATDAAPGRRAGFADVAGSARAVGALLDERAVAAGAPVLLGVADRLAFAVAFLGVLAAGRRCVPVDPSAPAPELARVAAALEPELLLTDGTAAVPGVPAHRVDLDELVGEDPPAPGRVGAVLLHTSGSTGAPKTVELAEPRLLHVASAVAAHHQLTEDDRGYNPLPLFHINGEVVGILASLIAGATLILPDRFRRTGFWRELREVDATWLNAVPAMLAIVADEPAPRLPGLRFVRSASASLPVELRRRIEQRLGVPVVESYGMTEAASQITATPLDGSAPAGSAGRPVGVELEVRGRDGRPVETGTVGRIWIRGPGVIAGYLGNRGAERFDADGWLNTGDLGRVDAAGFVFLAGRADDVINRGGEMIYPREIEEVLLGDPRVREAVVVPRPHRVLGAVPVAYVVSHDGHADAPGFGAELADRCVAHLARAKRPADIHLVADLPRAATGKILRHVVRDGAETAACAS